MDRQLLNYLPPVLRVVQEFQTINGANEPEISRAWDALGRVLANQFLEDADEDGVTIWEKELRLYPKDTDTLEARKVRIHAKWNLELPYTLPWLRRWLSSISEGLPFETFTQDYILHILTEWDRDGQVDSIKNILEHTVPANMVINSINSIKCNTESSLYVATGLALCDCIFISDSGNMDITISMPTTLAAGLVACEGVGLSDSGKTDIAVAIPATLATGLVTCEGVGLSDAGSTTLSINNPVVNPAGIVTAELINISD